MPQPSKRIGPPPTRESFHLGMARSAFLHDERPIDEALVDYEAAVAHVLAGGTLNQRGRVPGAHDIREVGMASINDLRGIATMGELR